MSHGARLGALLHNHPTGMKGLDAGLKAAFCPSPPPPPGGQDAVSHGARLGALLHNHPTGMQGLDCGPGCLLSIPPTSSWRSGCCVLWGQAGSTAA